MNILDTAGSLYSMARFGGFMDKHGDFPGSFLAFCCDATANSIGALFGTPLVATYIESGSGTAEGGRTSLTAITTAFLFFLSSCFAPIFASFPPWATGPALIYVGAMMVSSVRDINWNYWGDAVPAFLIIVMMPLTYSTTYGLVVGIFTHMVINFLVWLIGKLPRRRWGGVKDKDKKEAWRCFIHKTERV